MKCDFFSLQLPQDWIITLQQLLQTPDLGGAPRGSGVSPCPAQLSHIPLCFPDSPARTRSLTHFFINSELFSEQLTRTPCETGICPDIALQCLLVSLCWSGREEQVHTKGLNTPTRSDSTPCASHPHKRLYQENLTRANGTGNKPANEHSLSKCMGFT